MTVDEGISLVAGMRNGSWYMILVELSVLSIVGIDMNGMETNGIFFFLFCVAGLALNETVAVSV